MIASLAMPEYFFHLAIETRIDRAQATNSIQSDQNCWISGERALSPFLPSEGRAWQTSHIHHVRARAPQRNAQNLRPEAHKEGPALFQFSSFEADVDDQRLDRVTMEGIDMVANCESSFESRIDRKEDHINKGIGTALGGIKTKGHFVPVNQENTEDTWGIVHLYRDADETQGLYGDSPLSKTTNPWYGGKIPKSDTGHKHPPVSDEDCTMLCILAVPSYMAPGDFLAFVGEDTRNEVSHFRMIKTSRTNRYMVLMKFRNGKKSREWQREWNGKVFNSVEPETCHVVFLKSVELVSIPAATSGQGVPSGDEPLSLLSPSTSVSNLPPPLHTTKPLAPRTPALIELPTCPVCLERMDETTGLLTILCQHVFHCTCLQKWSGGGCPVCRFTHDDFSTRNNTIMKSKKDYLENDYNAECLACETCHIDSNLWQCLICGKVGCGRYEAKHAFAHFEKSGHTFSMDLESKRVWDYTSDAYVHRIIQDAHDGAGGKLVELPGPRDGHEVTALDSDEEDGKMQGVALEYTHLLTSQLESQRVYFEERFGNAADKISKATETATRANESMEKMRIEMADLKQKYDDLARDTYPALEKEKGRIEKRSAKFEEMARKMEKEYREEESNQWSIDGKN